MRHGQVRRLNGRIYHYDRHRVERVVDFFESFIHYTTADWEGKPWRFLKWQRRELIEPFFGWLREDGTRQYREVYCETPKKSGKSELAAALALNALINDDEGTPEVYSAAAEKKQASICWQRAAMMVELEPELSARLKCFPEKSTSYKNPGNKSIVCESNHGSYEALSAEAYSKEGYHVSCVVFDEFHEQPNADLYETLKKGTIARPQPQFWIITNSGHDQTTICYQKHQEAKRVMADPEADPELLGVVYGSGADEDWTSPKVWKKAHPSFGITVKKDVYEAEIRRALDNPVYENNVRRLLLGQWTSQSIVWMPMHRWDKCAFPVDAKALEGRQCWAGLDLANVQDLAALVLVFPPVEEGQRWEVLPYAWIPEERIAKRIKDDQVHYDVWIRQGYLETTPGDVVDFDYIERFIQDLDSRYLIRQIAVDPHQAMQLLVNLNEHYVEKYPRVDDNETWAVKCPQGYALSSAMRMLLEQLVLKEQLAHGGHPLLRWNMDNMVAKTGRSGDLMPDRPMARKKIDLGVALVMAIKAAVEGRGPNRSTRRRNVYEERDMVVI